MVAAAELLNALPGHNLVAGRQLNLPFAECHEPDAGNSDGRDPALVRTAGRRE
jgi:hypothetical protein